MARNNRQLHVFDSASRLVLVALTVCLAGCRVPTDAQTDAASPQAEAESTETPLPATVELQILDFDGIEKLLASHHGKVVVMDAWSTSCEPCVREFPNLVALSKKYPADKLACVSLSFDYYGGETPDELAPAIREFLQGQGATFDNILSSTPDNELYKKLDLSAIPAVFVYHRDGSLARRFDNEADGEFTYDDIEPFVATLIEQP